MSRPLTGDKFEIAVLNAELCGLSELINEWQGVAQRRAIAIERVREVIEKHWNDNICSLSTYQEIIKALDGEQ